MAAITCQFRSAAFALTNCGLQAILTGVKLDFESVKAEGVALQSQLPWLELVAVGGTAAAMHARHRFSTDVDCVTRILKDDFDLVSERLDEWDGWKTARFNRPVIILGERHGIELGVRQQIRTVPLEVERVDGLVIPTVEESLRIKAFLLGKRKATRDYVDVAALSDMLGPEAALEALLPLNAVYPTKGKGGLSALSQFASAAKETPADLDAILLSDYKGIRPPYDRWEHVHAACGALGKAAFSAEMTDPRIESLEGQSFHSVSSVRSHLSRKNGL